jgi:hypothetical protein
VKTNGVKTNGVKTNSMNTNTTDNGYEIRIRDHLDDHWFVWFEDWTITNLENGEVLLRSTKVDQSGVHGALNKIRDLNLMLLSVSQIHREE